MDNSEPFGNPSKLLGVAPELEKHPMQWGGGGGGSGNARLVGGNSHN